MRELKEAGRAIKANLTLSERERKEKLPGSTLDPEQSEVLGKFGKALRKSQAKSPIKRGAPSLPGKGLS